MEGHPRHFFSAADDKNFIVRALEAGGVDYIHQALLIQPNSFHGYVPSWC